MTENRTPDRRYLELLARDYPDAEAAAAEIVRLSALRSLPKGTEYFFSDLHGEYDSFSRLLRSASGMSRAKIDLVFEKSLSSAERTALAELIYAPEAVLKEMNRAGEIDGEWRSLTLYRLIQVSEAVSAKYTRAEVRKKMPEAFRKLYEKNKEVIPYQGKHFDLMISDFEDALTHPNAADLEAAKAALAEAVKKLG